MDGWSTPRPGHFTPGEDPVPITQEAGWAPEPVWTGAENLALTGIRSPDRPARSESLSVNRIRKTSQTWTQNIEVQFVAPCLVLEKPRVQISAELMTKRIEAFSWFSLNNPKILRNLRCWYRHYINHKPQTDEPGLFLGETERRKRILKVLF